MVFPTTPLLDIRIRRQDALNAYGVWQRSQVDADQKSFYNLVQGLTAENCIDLEMIHANRGAMYSFYKGNGALKGITWHYVCDIKPFLKQHGTLEGIASLLRTREDI